MCGGPTTIWRAQASLFKWLRRLTLPRSVGFLRPKPVTYIGNVRLNFLSVVGYALTAGQLIDSRLSHAPPLTEYSLRSRMLTNQARRGAMTKVIVIGGGVAGMSAAHELLERGFDVEVYERNLHYVGGKARSVNVPGSNQVDRAMYLPGEHGFRFFPGFYKHVMNTMQRIPLGNGKTVYDNLVSTHTVMISQDDDKPIVMPVNFPKSLKDVVKMFKGFKSFSQELADDDIEYFSGRVWRLMTSCQSRFDEEYDGISWWDFTGAGQRGLAYQRLLAGGLTRSLVACKAHTASTRTGGAIFLQLLYLMMDASAEHTDRVLNGPTNDAWLNPWMDYLRGKGVTYQKGAVVNRIHVSAGKVSGVSYRPDGANQDVDVTADYYLLAVPVERAAGLVNKDI